MSEQKSLTLLERADEKIALWQLIHEAGGELNDTLETWLAQIDQNLAEKVDGYKFTMEELDGEADRLKARAADFTAAAKTLTNIIERMKDRIKFVMLSMQVKELSGEHYTFQLSERNAKLVLTPSEVPEFYQKIVQTLEIDKDRIYADLLAGVDVPGAKLEPVHALTPKVKKGAKKK